MIKKSSLILLLVFSPFLSLFSQKEDVVKNYTLGCSALVDLTDDNIRLKFSYANIDIYSYVIFNNDFLVYNVKNKVGLVDLKNGLELDAFNFNDYKTDYSYIKGIKNIKIINDTLIHIGFFIKKDSTTKKLNDDLLFLKVKENRLTTYFIKNDLTNSFNPKLESFNTNGGLEVLEFDLQFDKYFYGYNYSPYWNNCTGIKDCKKYKYAASIYYKDSKDSSTKTLLETEYNNPKYATYSPLIYPVGNSLLCTFDIESRDSIIVFDKNLNILKRGNFKSLFENKLLIEEKRKILFYNFILDNKTKYIYIEVDSQDSIYRYNDFYKINLLEDLDFNFSKISSFKTPIKYYKKVLMLNQIIYDNILYFTLKNPNFNDRGIYSYDLSKIKFNIPLQFKEPQIKSFNNSGLFYSKNDNSNNFYDKHKIALKRDIKKLYVDGIVDRDTVEYPQSSLSDLFRSINKALLREDYNYIKSYLLMYNKYDYPNENDWIQKQITTENEEWRKESLLFFNQLLEGKYFISKRFTDDSIIISSKNTEVFLKKIENNWYMGLTIINYN